MLGFKTLLLCSALLAVPSLGQLDWWQRTTVYQIYPRSFQDSDGDGTGDLKGIESRLDYLEGLGVECIWLSPIYKSPMADFGYDVSDYYQVDPIFGTMEDFDNLLANIKSRGMKLVMDIVPNHSSDEHEWFVKSVAREDPYTDYYVWADPSGFNGDEPLPPSNWISVFRGPAWTYREEREQFYLHQFLDKQPDFDAYNDAVNDELLAVVRFWLEKGIDGFRVDAIKHYAEVEDVTLDEPISGLTNDTEDYGYLTHTLTVFQQQTLDVMLLWRELLDEFTTSTGETKIMMTEVTGAGLENDVELIMAYYGTEESPIAHFTFNFRFIENLAAPLTGVSVADTVKGWFNDMPSFGWANWVIGNHDQFRVATRFGPELVDAVNMIVTLVPGTAITYQGEELGMENTFITWEETQDPQGCNCGEERYEECSRDPARTPMQWSDESFAGFTEGDSTWLPVNPNYVTLNVEAQEAALESHLKVYKSLLEQRARAVIQESDITYLDDLIDDETFVFLRELNGEGVAVLVNFAADLRFYDLSSYLPETAVVVTRSIQGAAGGTTQPGSTIFANSVPVGSQEGIVLAYEL